MAPTRQKRKEEIVKKRREQILDAAMEVFSRKGFAMATTAEIARAAGVAEGTIYNYFPSKRELFIAVIQNYVITTPLLELIDKLKEGNIAITFSQILQNRFQLIENKNVSRMPSLLADIQRDPELKSLWQEQFLQPFFSRMEEIYGNMMASSRFRQMEPAVFVRYIGGLFIGSLMLKVMEGDASPLNRLPRDEVIKDMVDLILHGLLDRTNKKE